jgi:CHAT domain-containing protein
VALNARRDEIGRQFPAYADLVTPATPTLNQLRVLLGDKEALVVVHPLRDATLVWLVGADGRRAFYARPLGAAALATRVTALRSMLDLSSSAAGKAPPLQPELLHALYRDLFSPLEPQLAGVAGAAGVASLIVATDGPLASLPLGTLVTRAPQAGAAPAWLVRQMAVTQLPSASSLQALRRVRPTLAGKALIGFGDPLFDRGAARSGNAAGSRAPLAPLAQLAQLGARASRYDAEWGFRYAEVPPLPETRTELLALAAALGADPRADLVMGASATRAAVLAADLSDRRVVAFATHGLMPGELPGVSKPALAMAANADERESPLLELDDVLGLRLNAQWVLLSACNTAAGGEQGGAAMSGLVRGFFFAGTRSVLATHWAVESESAAAMSSGIFQVQSRGASRAESLRQAQLAMIDGSRWQHPYYWAAYALFGDPQR